MMEPGARDEFLRLLERQRAEYLQALPLRLALVENLWSGIANGAAAPDDFACLVRTAHGLAGSGAMFGFDELGAAAKALELRLQAGAQSPLGPQGKDRDGIEDSIARLRSCAPRAA
jgi:HPt (histidine-containing phosphotransfer) domain-containing protein